VPDVQSMQWDHVDVSRPECFECQAFHTKQRWLVYMLEVRGEGKEPSSAFCAQCPLALWLTRPLAHSLNHSPSLPVSVSVSPDTAHKEALCLARTRSCLHSHS
jgi:hypothetical protein